MKNNGQTDADYYKIDTLLMGKKIRYCRKTVFMTQKEFGKYFGTTEHCISKYETGRAVPKLPFLAELARCFKIALEDLADNFLPFEDFAVKYTQIYLLLNASGGLIYID